MTCRPDYAHSTEAKARFDAEQRALIRAKVLRQWLRERRRREQDTRILKQQLAALEGIEAAEAAGDLTIARTEAPGRGTVTTRPSAR